MEQPLRPVRRGGPPRTKISVPTSTAPTVRREAVEAVLDRSARVTTIVGAAGFGKTTAVATWAAQRSEAVAWYTVDAFDARPSVFWRNLTAAIERVSPVTGTDGDDDPTAWPTSDAPVDALLAALGDDPAVTVVVVDDLHLVDEIAVVEQLTYFVERAPAALRFVLIARRELPLPLGRWAVRGLLAEVTEPQLSMDPTEAAAVVRSGAPADVSTEAVDVVVDAASGWPAALRLAGLNLVGDAGTRGPTPGRVRHFRDFVAEEVLTILPADVRATVAELALFDDLDPRRCELLLGVPDGGSLLDDLVRWGLPMVVLDPASHGHRLHALVREVLIDELATTRAADLPELHSRVAAVELAVGDAPAAVRHLIAAGDLDAAFGIVFAPVSELYRSGSIRRLADWIDRFPTDFVAGSAERCATFALTLAYLGRQDEADRWSRAASELAGTPSPSLDVALTRSRVMTALDRGDTAAVRAEIGALQARHGADGIDRDRDSQLHTAMAVADLVDERLDDAERWVAAMARRPDLPERLRTVGQPTRAAWAAFLRGSLDEATALAQGVLDAGADAGRAALPVTIELFALLGALAVERADLDAADHWVGRAAHRLAGMPPRLHRYLVDRVAVAAVEARSGSEGALRTVRAASVGAPVPLAHRYEWLAADLEARSGMRTAATRRLAHLPPSPRRAVVAARLAALADRPESAREHLVGLTDGPQALRIEAALLEARIAPGSDAPGRAVALGATAGYVWTYRREGPDLAAALRDVVLGDPRWATTALAESLRSRPGTAEPTVAILTVAEHRVLAFLPSHRSLAEIAAELHVSVNTVKTHTRSVYRKLGVDGRSAAVQRAERLGLLH